MGPLNLGALRNTSVFGGIQPNPYQGIFTGQPEQENMWGTLFQPNAMVGSPLGGGIPQPSNSIMDIINQLYTPEHTDEDALRQLVGQMPTHQPPGTLRKIGATLAGFSSRPDRMQVQERILNRPYLDKLEEWKNKLQPTEQLANLERYGNANERSLATSVAQSEVSQRRSEEQNRIAQERVDAYNRKIDLDNEIKQYRAEIYDFKAHHPNMKIVVPKGGNVYAVDPITKETFDLGIPSGTLTEIQKLDLTHEDTMEEIAARGAQARATKAIPTPGAAANKPELSSQKKIREYINARELYNTDPELGKFIELGDPGTNDFKVGRSESTWFGLGPNTGPDPDQLRRINQKIYGNPNGPGPEAPSQNVMTKTQTNTRTGAKRTLVSTDGGKTWHEQVK